MKHTETEKYFEETEEQTEICKKFSEVKDFIEKYVKRGSS